MKKILLGFLAAVFAGVAVYASEPLKVKASGLHTTAVNSSVATAAEAGFATKVSLGTDSRLFIRKAFRANEEAVKPPYTATFDTDLDGFSTIDANLDGTTWKYTSNGGGAAVVNSSSTVATNDWLVSVPIELKGGVTYEVSIDAKGYSKTYAESFEVKAGTEPTAAALTTAIIPAVSFNSQDYQAYTGTFTPEADGVYYFGIHGISKKDQFGLLVDNFSIKSDEPVVEAVEPPFTATFDNDLCGFEVIDANSDGTTWEHASTNGGEAKVKFNVQHATDDWLVSPAIELKAGVSYGISVDARGYSDVYYERFEVKAGAAAAVDAMTYTVIAPVLFNEGDYITYTGVFVAPADGVYYFGIHGISPADNYSLFVDNFKITAPQGDGVPAAVQDLTAIPDGHGALSAVISFVAPSTTDTGKPLPTITKIEINRGSTLVTTFEEPLPGKKLAFTDVPPKEGYYTYTVTPYNENGAGIAAEVKVFVGVALPASVKNLDYKETAKEGEVTISWDAVTTDVNGVAIADGEVTYNVYKVGNEALEPLAYGVTATNYTYQAVPEGTQKFVQFAVFAETYAGQGNGAATGYGPVGTPYRGYTLSSEADLDTYILGVDYTGGLSAGIYGDNDFAELGSVDGDDFYLGFYGTALNQYGSIFTGKITLEGMKNPALVYHTYNLALNDGAVDSNELIATVTDVATGISTDVSTVDVSTTGGTDMWNRVQIDLSAFAGKVITIEITAVVRAAAYTFIDAISVSSLVEHDLSAEIQAPANVLAGDSFTADVIVKNVGAEDAGAYKVSLFADDTLVGTKEYESLACGRAATASFTVATSVVATAPVRLSATVEYAADEVPANNTAREVTVEIVKSNLPAVNDLKATVTNDGVALTWTEPDLDAYPAERITESFENGDAFSAEFGEWIFVDVDDSPVGGISTHDIPGITPGTTKGSFWIWDTNLLTDRMTGAHTGNKFLFSLFRFDDEEADDWAISPELDGSAQEITFYAKSYTSTYLDRIEIYYSTGSTAIEDFELLVPKQVVLPYWEYYEIELPQGARRFAIRSCAKAGFMLAIDDVSYIPAGGANLDLVGYNVYRDGVRINDATVEETEYLDETAETGKTYTYAVTTIYTKGESAASNLASTADTAVAGVSAAAVSVRAITGGIEIRGAQGLEASVFAADGTLRWQATCGAAAKAVLPAGLYLVKVGTTVSKVLVK